MEEATKIRGKPGSSKKRLVYIVATFAAVGIFVPFQASPWAIYAGVCAGYSILVFGLRRVNAGVRTSPSASSPVTAGMLVTHLTFLAIVIGWVWLLNFLRPQLPYFLRTEDTTRPYFGLIFLGILGLLGIEYAEQRGLRPDEEIGVNRSSDVSARMPTTRE